MNREPSRPREPASQLRCPTRKTSHGISKAISPAHLLALNLGRVAVSSYDVWLLVGPSRQGYGRYPGAPSSRPYPCVVRATTVTMSPSFSRATKNDTTGFWMKGVSTATR